MKVKTKARDRNAPASREASAARAAEAPTYTVEDLNPRGKTATELIMTIKRGYTLCALCTDWLSRCGDSSERAMSMTPFFSGHDSIKRKIKECFAVESEYMAARRWADWWPWVFTLWLRGSLERQLQEAALNLPSSLRTKVKEWEPR